MSFIKNKYVAESIGAFFLTLVYGISGDVFAIGFTLSALIYFSALISGAHFNPAISIAAFILRKISLAELINYILAQIAGAFLAAVAILYLSDLVYYVEPPLNTSFYQQLSIEIIFSALLILVALTAWIGNPKHKSIATYSFIMGFTLVACFTIADSISGGIFNPAISISTSALDFFLGGASYIYIPIYTIGPIVGAVLATLGYKFLIADSD